jgi:hypothetical protein
MVFRVRLDRRQPGFAVVFDVATSQTLPFIIFLG